MYRTIYLTTFDQWIEEIPDSPILNTPAQWYPERYAYTTWDGQWYQLLQYQFAFTRPGTKSHKWEWVSPEQVPKNIRTRALLLI